MQAAFSPLFWGNVLPPGVRLLALGEWAPTAVSASWPALDRVPVKRLLCVALFQPVNVPAVSTVQSWLFIL